MYVGSCLCGAVKYEVSPPLKFVVHDHCSICRRATGAAFVTWCGVRAQQFRLMSGQEFIRVYKSTSQAERRFCKTCGSQLFFQSTHWPGEIHFTRASLLTEDIPDLPTSHVYYSDKASWMTIADDLPKFGGKSGMEPLGK